MAAGSLCSGSSGAPEARAWRRQSVQRHNPTNGGGLGVTWSTCGNFIGTKMQSFYRNKKLGVL